MSKKLFLVCAISAGIFVAAFVTGVWTHDSRWLETSGIFSVWCGISGFAGLLTGALEDRA